MRFYKAASLAYEKKFENDGEAVEFIDKNNIMNIQVIFSEVTFNYPDKIYFECVGCGNCCKQNVALMKCEHDSYDTMKDLNGKICIKKEKDFDDCTFLNDDKKCSIYNTRSFCCRCYPWMISSKSVNDKINFVLYSEGGKHTACHGFHVGVISEKTLQSLKVFARYFNKNIDKCAKSIRDEDK